MSLSFVFHFFFLTLTILATSERSTEIPSRATALYPCGHFDPNIPMEFAQITFTSTIQNDIFIYGISDYCYECLYLPISLSPLNNSQNSSLCIVVDTQHPYSIGYSTQFPFSGCKQEQKTCAWQPTKWIFRPSSYHYNEYSHYSISINETIATIKMTKSSQNKYIPLYILLLTLFIIFITYNIYRLYLIFPKDSNDGIISNQNQNNNDDNDNAKVYVYKQKKTKKRFISLDAFRGMSLLIMIFVNYGGGGYWFLSHSDWNGLTVADLVFPWFVFIMGTAMAIVFPRKLKKISHAQQQHVQSPAPYNVPLVINNSSQKPTISRWQLLKKIIIRTVKLMVIGICIINHAHDLEYIRIPGVLQYFAISYLINSLIIICTEPLDDLEERSKASLYNLYFPEIAMYWKQWLIALSILCIQLLVVFMLPVTLYDEKCPTGYLGPGGIGDYGKYIECTGGAHRYVDLKLFGENHVYGSPTSHSLYHTGWYDPEGFLGSISAVVLTFFGIFAGRILTVYKTHSERLFRWFLMCVVFGFIAGFLCGFAQNGGLIPVNKNMWSLSFICCQASSGIFVLMIFYVLIDVKSIWSGMPFHWLGSNSIIIYVGSEVFESYFPWSFEYGEANHYKKLLSNVIGVSVWIAIAAYLYKRKIFYSL